MSRDLCDPKLTKVKLEPTCIHDRGHQIVNLDMSTSSRSELRMPDNFTNNVACGLKQICDMDAYDDFLSQVYN